MKAKFLALAALVLGMASCQTDVVDGVKVDANGEAAVTLQVGLPAETRAATDSGIGAIGNIDLANEFDIRYILEVYDGAGDLAKERMVNREGESTETSFSLRLVPGRTYKFVVWADFIPQDQVGEADYHYSTSNLSQIGLYGDQKLNDESRDAYTGFVVVNDFKSSSSVSLELTRPFAKLRVVTTDMNQLYSPLESATVAYTSKLYTQFNAIDAKVVETSLTDDINKTVVYENMSYVESGDKTLFADYFFGSEDDAVQFTLDVDDKTDYTIPQMVFNTNIPVQRNYLTTVKGNILTDANNITVEIKDAFAGEYTEDLDNDTTESFVAALKDAENSVEAVIELTGDVVWATGAGIGSTPWIPEGAKTEKLTINANGHKITATGSGVGAIRMANGGTLIINNAIIEDKSVSYAENNWEYGYLEFAGNLQFNECEFVNGIMVEDGNATFVECKFNSNEDNMYAVWVSGNKAYFKKCVIEGPRGIKMHEAYGSEVEEVVINKCQFNNIYKKPGVAIGDVNAETKVVIMNSSFTNCQAGDQGLYIYETDTDVTTFTFTEKNNFVDGVNKAENNTYNISSAQGFQYIAEAVNNGTETVEKIVLYNDIDLNEYAITRGAASNWAPIGTYDNPFTGEFDGKNYTIKNLNIVVEEAKEGKAYIGFFGYAKDATIKNVAFENVNLNVACLDIDHSQGHIGAIAGSLEGTSTIENVTVKGDIKVESTVTANGASRVAVVAGGNANGNVTMKNVHVIANEGSYLKANNNVGALAGQLQGKSVFENCSSNIDVTGTKFFAGGIIGLAAGDQLFTDCHTTGDVTITAGREGRVHDHYRVGGIAGGWADGATKVCTLTNCSYTGNLSGTNADGSVAKNFDYAGFVGRGYTLTGCQGSKVVIDGISYVQKYNTAAEAGVYDVFDAEGNTILADGVVLKQDGAYYISNKAGMFWFANEVNVNKNSFAGKTVKIANDIDLENDLWIPIGQTGATTFNGVFDGQEHTIYNLKVGSYSQTGAHYSSGLFGWIETHTEGCGILKNVKIENALIEGRHNCGALVGYITEKYALVENCSVKSATVHCWWANDDANGDKVGALIGNATVATTVKNCHAYDSTVKAARDAGQLIGAAKEANVTGCTAENVHVEFMGYGNNTNIREEVIGRLL